MDRVRSWFIVVLTGGVLLTACTPPEGTPTPSPAPPLSSLPSPTPTPEGAAPAPPPTATAPSIPATTLEPARPASDGPAVGTLPTVEIVKVWSDQFRDVVANYLPGGAGITGKDRYILAGAREDGRAYAKAEIRITPDTPAAPKELLVRLAFVDRSGSKVPVGNGTIAGNVASMSIAPVKIPDVPVATFFENYTVVAGFDTNDNHELDENEVTATTPYQFKFVSAFGYVPNVVVLTAAEAVALLTSIVRAGWEKLGVRLPGLNHSPLLLRTFLQLIPPRDATREDTLLQYADQTCVDEVMCLGHNVGALFGRDGKAPVTRWVFPPASEFAHDIRSSTTWINILDRERKASTTQAQEFFSNPASGGSPNDRYIFDRQVTEQMDFDPKDHVIATARDWDLWLAIGKANVNVKLTFTFQRAGGQLISLRITGTMEDLYDWHYDTDPNLAMIQAGYGSLGIYGQVFLWRAQLDCEYLDLPVYLGEKTKGGEPQQRGCSVIGNVRNTENESARGAGLGQAASGPGAPDLMSVAERLVQRGVDRKTFGVGRRGESYAGSAVGGSSTDNERTTSSLEGVAIQSGSRTVSAVRFRPRLTVTFHPRYGSQATIAKSHSATLVLGGVSTSVVRRTNPHEWIGRIDSLLSASDRDVSEPYEVRIYAAIRSTPNDDLFDQGVLVGTFKTDEIPSKGPLRVKIDIDALRSLGRDDLSSVVFVVRGFEDLRGLLQETTVTEEVTEVRDHRLVPAPYVGRDVLKWFGRGKFVLFPRGDSDFPPVEPSFLVLEQGKPEVAGGGIAAPNVLVGVAEAHPQVSP